MKKIPSVVILYFCIVGETIVRKHIDKKKAEMFRDGWNDPSTTTKCRIRRVRYVSEK